MIFSRDLRLKGKCTEQSHETRLTLKIEAVCALGYKSELVRKQRLIRLGRTKARLFGRDIGSHLGSDDPKQCNQIKDMPCIQTSLVESERERPKTTTLYTYNVSLILVACL